MEISQREKDNITILDIQGEIDLYNAPEISTCTMRRKSKTSSRS